VYLDSLKIPFQTRAEIESAQTRFEAVCVPFKNRLKFNRDDPKGTIYEDTLDYHRNLKNSHNYLPTIKLGWYQNLVKSKDERLKIGPNGKNTQTGHTDW